MAVLPMLLRVFVAPARPPDPLMETSATFCFISSSRLARIDAEGCCPLIRVVGFLLFVITAFDDGFDELSEGPPERPAAPSGFKF